MIEEILFTLPGRPSFEEIELAISRTFGTMVKTILPGKELGDESFCLLKFVAGGKVRDFMVHTQGEPDTPFHGVTYCSLSDTPEGIVDELRGIAHRFGGKFYIVDDEDGARKELPFGEPCDDTRAGDPPSHHRVAKTLRLFAMHAFFAAMGECDPREEHKDIRRLYHRMRKPKIGDLVFEMTTARGADDDEHIDAVGYLLSEGEGVDGSGRKGHHYKIRTLDGREFTWGNAEFIALPEALQSLPLTGPGR